MALCEVIAALDQFGMNSEKSGSDYRSRCPVHKGKGKSLKISEAPNGNVGVKCWAKSCKFEDIQAALSLDTSVFFGPGRQQEKPVGKACRYRGGDMGKKVAGFDRPTLEQLAAKSGTTTEHLKGLGWRFGEWPIERSKGGTFEVGGVRIPYFVAGGKEVFAKIRVSLDGDPKYLPEKLGTHAYLYGEESLEEYRSQPRPNGYKGAWPVLILEEGETDRAAFTFQDPPLPAAGIPGVDTVARVLKAKHVKGFGKIIILKEPGDAGDTFCRNIYAQLNELKWEGVAQVIELPAGDAAAQLRQSNGDFMAVFRLAMSQAVHLRQAVEAKKTAGLIVWAHKAKLKPMRFLMFPHLVIGVLNLWAGKPGEGKSWTMMKLAAMLSRGKVIPVCNPDRSELGTRRTLVFSADDTPKATLIPRFLACGGDPSYLAIYDQDKHPVTLADIQTVSDVVDAVDPAVIFFDPWEEYVKQVGGQQSEAIAAIRPLCKLAAANNAALIGVGWSPKSPADKSAQGYFAGSIARAGKMRSGCVVIPGESEKGVAKRGIFAHAKGNYGVEGKSIGYEITTEESEPAADVIGGLEAYEIEIVREIGTFRWTGEVEQTADELVAMVAGEKPQSVTAQAGGSSYGDGSDAPW